MVGLSFIIIWYPIPTCPCSSVWEMRGKCGQLPFLMGREQEENPLSSTVGLARVNLERSSLQIPCKGRVRSIEVRHETKQNGKQTHNVAQPFIILYITWTWTWTFKIIFNFLIYFLYFCIFIWRIIISRTDALVRIFMESGCYNCQNCGVNCKYCWLLPFFD